MGPLPRKFLPEDISLLESLAIVLNQALFITFLKFILKVLIIHTWVQYPVLFGHFSSELGLTDMLRLANY